MDTIIVLLDRKDFIQRMIALQIENIKKFMVELFQGEMFDRFRVGECEVLTFVRFTTDGRRNEAWYDTEEKSLDDTGLVGWKELKPIVFELIKGKKVPEKMCIDFCHYMPSGDMGSIRVQYENGVLHMFSGYMQKEFSMDRSGQYSWDEKCRGFIKKHAIEYSETD